MQPSFVFYEPRKYKMLLFLDERLWFFVCSFLSSHIILDRCTSAFIQYRDIMYYQQDGCEINGGEGEAKKGNTG